MKHTFVDTHAHIHFDDYPLNVDETWREANQAGVTRMLATGCDISSSRGAAELARKYDGIYAVVGVHPHEAAKFLVDEEGKNHLELLLDEAKSNKIVAIGEFGLDYYYNHSPKEAQIEVLRYHLSLAQKYDLPVCMHVREAFDDLWPIFDEFHAKRPLRGLVHCFTGVQADMEQALSRGLYVALNGIMTFTKDQNQLEAARLLPLNKMLLETDAPYLTPKPLRGKICKPEHVVLTAEFLAGLRGESVGELADQTTKNFFNLFNVR